jgi:hypothetical protein
VDTYLEIYDDNGNQLIGQNVPNGYEAFTDSVFQPGEYWVRVSSRGNSRGEYYLSLEKCGEICCYDALLEQNQVNDINPSTGRFNFAADVPDDEFYIGRNLTVPGHLSFGLDGQEGFPGGNVIGGTEDFKATVCNNKFIAAQNGGLVEVGNDVDVDLHFSDGTALIIDNGGEVRIHGGSKIVIEEGAKLVINGYDALLNLTNQSSRIIIKGKLEVNANCRFAAYGPGTIEFDQSTWVNGQLALGTFYDFHPSSEIYFFGTNGNRPRLELKQPVYFKDGDGDAPQGFQMVNTDILLHSGAFLYTFSPSLISHCVFDEALANQFPTHGGMRIYGNAGFNKIQNCTFKNGGLGVLAHWLGNHDPLRILDNTFDNVETSLKLESGRFDVQRNTFLNNGGGISTLGLQGFSKFNHNNFDGNVLDLFASNQTTVEVYGNEFKNVNYGAAVYLDQTNANFGCNNFISNNLGININYGYAYLDNESYNYFYDNWRAIAFGLEEQAWQHGLYLNEGYNQFLLGPNGSTNLHVYGSFLFNGSFAGSLPQSNYVTNANGTAMAADFNEFELRQVPCPPNVQCPSSGYIYEMPVSMQVYTPSPGGFIHGYVELDVPNNLQNISSTCSNANPSEHDHPTLNFVSGLQSPSSGGLVGTTGSNPQDLVIEGIENLSYGDVANNDPNALDMFQTILTSQISNPDNNTSILLEHSYGLMLTALENCFYYDFFQYEGGDTTAVIHNEVQAVQQIIDTALSNLNPQDSGYYRDRFYFNLNKVMSYRNGGFYDAALNHLEFRNNWVLGNEQTQRANYWNCICEAEAGYFSEELSADEYTSAREYCELTYAGYNYKRGVQAENPGGYIFAENASANILNLYPQPVINNLNLEFSEALVGKEKLEIIEMSGKRVSQRQVQLAGKVLSLDCSKLEPGMYIIKLTHEAGTTSSRLIKKGE